MRKFIAAVIHRPPVLILDEPFSGLDPVNATVIKDIMLELRQKVGHDMLWLATAMGAVFDSDGRVLLGRRADNGAWTLPGGIIDPAEQRADADLVDTWLESWLVRDA